MRNTCIELEARVWTPKPAVIEGPPLVVEEPISFLGDVDPEKGVLKASGEVLANRVLVVKGFRGSTVGSYVLYALSKRGAAPLAIVFKDLDPVVVAGCVASSIPMAWCPSLDMRIARGCRIVSIDPFTSVVRLCS